MNEEYHKAKHEFIRIMNHYEKYYDDEYLKILLQTWAKMVPTKDAAEMLKVALDLLKTKYTMCREDEETMIIDALGEKLKLGRLVNKLPELEGVFEKHCRALIAEEIGDDSRITITFNIPKNDPDQLRLPHAIYPNKDSAYSPVKLVISTVSEDRSNLIGKNFKLDVNYLPDKVILTITDFTDINSRFPNFKNLSLTQQQDYMADRFQRVITNQGRNFITNNNAFAKFKQSIDVQIYSRFRNLSNKLPETEGLFESSIDNTEYTYTCTFKRVPENLKQTLRSVLVKVFDSLIFRLKINFQQKCNYEILALNDNIVGKLTNLTIHPNSQKQIGGWIDRWVIEEIYENWPYKQWPDSDNDKIIEELVSDENFVSVWKTKYEDLTNKHPELKGVFESKSADDFGGDISDRSPYRLEVKVNIKNGGYLKLVKNVLENVQRFFELPVYGWPCNIVKDEDENLILNVMLADALTLKGAQNHQQVVKRVVTMRFEKEGLFEYFDEDEDIKYKIVETTFDKLKEKLPEIKGIFESRLDKNKSVLYVNFEPIADSAVAELLEAILNKTSRYFNFWFDDNPSSVNKKNNKNGTCFTFVLDCSNIVKANTTEGGETVFWNNYRDTQEEIYRNTKIPSEVRQDYGKVVRWNFEWASKYKEMVGKLPELEGIFESACSSLFKKYLG